MESGIKLDGILLIAVLYACSHSGLVSQGNELFDNMMNVYGIKPTIEHYGCMVDLYGRAGQLMKACDFISKMPIPPNSVIWRTLLGSCSFYGNIELAENVQKRLLELDLKHSGDYVLLSNIYAGVGKWKDAASLRSSMAKVNMTKTPGWSMIEVDKTMFTFVAGVKEDDVNKEAYEKLKEIMLRISVEGGYVPETVNKVLYDIEQEEKEDAIVTHSEKLAVAFGMSRLTQGSAIRIMKNLSFAKIVIL